MQEVEWQEKLHHKSQYTVNWGLLEGLSWPYESLCPQPC